MSTTFNFRPFKAASVVALVLFAIPAIAIAGTGSSTRANLAGQSGYCRGFAEPGSPALGKVQLYTGSAATAGFHDVRVDIKLNPGKLSAGTYDVYLVNLYRDGTGQVVGCSASPLSSAMTVEGNGQTDFHATATRYTGEYELQVYVGPIGGPGYATAPATVDVP
jgi:hypothetical protein